MCYIRSIREFSFTTAKEIFSQYPCLFSDRPSMSRLAMCAKCRDASTSVGVTLPHSLHASIQVMEAVVSKRSNLYRVKAWETGTQRRNVQES